MKKIIGTLALISMFTTGAMASSARVNALQAPVHLVDALTIFGNPSDANKLPEVALIEYGASSTFGSAAKGGFLKAMDDSKLGFFLGAGSSTRVSATAGTLDFEGVENPFAVVYGSKAGDMGWGVAFTYSSSAKKSDLASTAAVETTLDSATQSKMGLTGSVDMGMWNVGATIGLGDTAKTTLNNAAADSATYTGTSTNLFGTYVMDTMTFRLKYDMGSTKIDKTVSSVKTSVQDSTENLITLSVINEFKKEGADFFYGASYLMYDKKDKGVSSTTTTTANALPVIIGVEADAASWLVLRGSITQNVLIGSTSVKTTETVANSTNHNTKVAAGMGLKFNKSVLDMTLSAENSGTVASNALGASAAYTYMF